MINTEKLNQALREKTKDITILEASKQSGINIVALQILILKRGNPDLLTYEKLCKWLNVPQSTFIVDENDLTTTA